MLKGISRLNKKAIEKLLIVDICSVTFNLPADYNKEKLQISVEWKRGKYTNETQPEIIVAGNVGDTQKIELNQIFEKNTTFYLSKDNLW